MVRLGVHVSIRGGLEKAVVRAKELGCTALQIFSRNPRGWQAAPLNTQGIINFGYLIAKEDIEPIIIHTPYLLNLASANEQIYKKSIAALTMDLHRARLLGANYVVTHIGSSKGQGAEIGLERVIQALKIALDPKSAVRLLLENGAGGGDEIGSSFEQIKLIMEEVKAGPRLGVCFDSCHAFVAGYDFRSKEKTNALAKEIERTIGLERISLLHINDAAGDLGSHLDRHEHIGKGKIGIRGFHNLLAHPSFRGIPIILETPKRDPQDDKRNLKKVREVLVSIYGKV
ncbi:MAG: deoxyribonuclease IV [bacterium]